MSRFADFLTRNPVKRFVVNHLNTYRRDIARTYAEQKRLEQASEDEVQAYQLARLRRLLSVARGSSYYRRLIDGFAKLPESFTFDDLRQFPFLTKTTLREREFELLVPDARHVYENYSGGSTGVPVRFYQDYSYKVQMSVSTRMCNELAGLFTGARVAKLWGAPQDKRQIEGWKGKTKLWLLNQRYYDTFDMGPERMDYYHRQMEAFQPDLIQAYAGSIYLLAKFLRSRGIEPSYPRVSIITSAEKLFPRMRDEISHVFPSAVFDRYGSREVSAMASECKQHDGMHIQMPGYIVETINAVTGRTVEGEPGEIAVTALANQAMPFLRYRIGDLGILTRKKCACGRVFWRLREIVGRMSDNFLMPDGRVVHGEYFTHLFYGRDGIEQFQFEQTSRESFTLRIVPSVGYSAELGERLSQEIRKMIGDSPRLAIEIHQQIPKTASGKYRFTLSRLGPEELIGVRSTR
ncbi:MAG: phenylacetate--CoA ligase family protein [Acidimicrobiia bacterium]|nr:phenylacetate--CoA ligase family protein [Acidimicrobiia bacterium]